MTSTSSFVNAPAPVRLSDASTFNGFYLRNNLASTGAVPAASPYNQCPDIIQSDVPIADPEITLSSLASWQTFYNTAPVAGANYYYVRGLNGALTAFSGTASLYWAPAQLILFPSTWKNNPMTTAKGQESVNIAAPSGHIGVGSNAFVFQNRGQLDAGAESFYSFVVQNSATPIPEISNWIEMSQLMTQQLSFGFRNTVSFDPASGEMLYRLGINIPFTIGQSATLQLTLTATGFASDDTVGFIGDCFTPEMKAISLLPVKMGSGPYVAGISINVDPGFSSSLAVQYWNTSNTLPAPGSTITLSVNYVVPPEQVELALQMNVLDSQYSLQNAKARLSTQPQPVVPVGAISFVVV